MTFTDLSVHAGNRAARHAVGDTSPHIDFVAKQVFEAPVSELEELVRVSSSSCNTDSVVIIQRGKNALRKPT